MKDDGVTDHVTIQPLCSEELINFMRARQYSEEHLGRLGLLMNPTYPSLTLQAP